MSTASMAHDEHDHGHDGKHHHAHTGHGHAGHSHSHAGHHHAYGAEDQRRIAWAFVTIAVFMIVEVVGGVLSGSLALLADAGHMISDAAALGFSWVAIHYGRRPATAELSYGYKRLEILAAFVNGCALFVIAAWIVIEAIRRFAAPVPVVGKTMLIVAVAGLALPGSHRLAVAWLLPTAGLTGAALALTARLTPVVAVGVVATAWVLVTAPTTVAGRLDVAFGAGAQLFWLALAIAGGTWLAAARSTVTTKLGRGA